MILCNVIVDAEGFYSPLPEPTPGRKKRDDALRSALQFTNQAIIIMNIILIMIIMIMILILFT